MKQLLKIFSLTTLLTLTACSNFGNNELSGAQSQLSEGLSKSALQIQQSGGQLKVVMPVDLAFKGRSSKLTPQMMQSLAQVTRTLQAYPDLHVKVVGYTDNRGNPKASRLVSLRRAMVVADYFRNHGISSERISTAGLGQENPVADNATSQGRTQNRRIEIQLS